MTTTQTTHTPFSLVLDECRDAQGAYTLRLADGTANGDTKACPIATVYQDHNAAHIVHCVNTYPALLAAVQEARNLLVGIRQDQLSTRWMYNDSLIANSLESMLDAAIAQAESEG